MVLYFDSEIIYRYNDNYNSCMISLYKFRDVYSVSKTWSSGPEFSTFRCLQHVTVMSKTLNFSIERSPLQRPLPPCERQRTCYIFHHSPSFFLRTQIDSPAGAFNDAFPECFIDHVSDFFLIKAGLLPQGGDIKPSF